MKKIGFLKQNEVIQFIKFCIVGVSNTAISYVSYLIVVSLGGHYILANIFGYITGTLNAFLWNNKWVFKTKQDENRNLILAFLKMVISYAGTGVVLNNAMLFIWIKYLGISQIIAPLINAVITMVINFLSNKFWVFKNKKQGKIDEY